MATLTISAANNASPIQITTSTSHNLATGQSVSIAKCDPNRDANGDWIVTVIGSTTFTLNGSNGTRTITNATNANPIVITVSSPHNYVSSQSITISGVGGNTNANGTRTIQVIDNLHFSLTGIAGNAAYTSGGTSTGVYTGTPGSVYVNSFAISAATNATPIVITTTTAHGYVSGETVTISGVGGNTNANGTFVISVISSTQFSLFSTTSTPTGGRAGIAGNGTYTSGGFVTLTLPFTFLNVDNLPEGYGMFSKLQSNANFFNNSALINILDYVDTEKYSGNSASYGNTIFAVSPFIDTEKYSGNSANYGETSLNDGYQLGIIDYDATSIYPKTQITYYKLRGYNSLTQQYETWVTSENIVERPELYTPGNNPPNYFNSIFYTPPSGNTLQNIVIIGKWVQ